MKVLFTHEDDDGDALEVGEAYDSHAGELVFNVITPSGAGGVFVPRAQAERLYDALGSWLFPGVIAAEDPEPIYAALIRRLVAEEVARVRESVVPLHSSPQAYVPECDATLCTIPGCGLIPDRPTHLEHDPEPHDVGIVDEPAPVEKRCPHGIGWNMRCVKCQESGDPARTTGVGECECGHLWSDHGKFGIRGCDAKHTNGSGCECSRAKPRLMAELPRRTPATVTKDLLKLRCAGCGHHQADHGALYCWGNPGTPDCTCKGFQTEPSTS